MQSIKFTPGQTVDIGRYQQANIEPVTISNRAVVLEIFQQEGYATGIAIKIMEEYGTEITLDQEWLDEID